MATRWSVLLALLVGCSTSRLEDEWAVTLDAMQGLPLAVVDSLPTAGSVGISQEFSPYLLLSRPLRTTESVTLDLVDDAGEAIPTTPRRDADDLGVRFAAGVLERDRGFSGQLSLGGLPSAELDFTTASPTGPAYNMSTGLDVERFGGGTGQLGLINELFIPGSFPLWTLQLEGVSAPATLPQVVDFVFAPSRLDDVSPQYVVHVEWGFVSVVRGVAFGADGGFSAQADALFLPLWSSEGVSLLHMTEVTLTGTASLAGTTVSLDSLTLTGVLGTRSLLLLADVSEGWHTAIAGSRPDVDTNGNGVPDAVTFGFSSTPSPIALDEVDQ